MDTPVLTVDEPAGNVDDLGLNVDRRMCGPASVLHNILRSDEPSDHNILWFGS